MLHLMQEAINPQLGLRRCLTNWADISLDLREPRRKRLLQATEMEENGICLF